MNGGVNLPNPTRGLRKTIRGAANRNARESLQYGNQKYKAGSDPLENESLLTRIEPTDKQQLAAMTKMLEDMYPNPTPQQSQALALWKFQIAKGTVGDQVKFQFLRRFYFWLLGRGSKDDTDKTMWGRANAAVYNPEVAAYIDQFTDKRALYAMKLNMLSMRIPDNLNGYYLYFKYIVNGGLKRIQNKDGTDYWDMSNEDYLEDFDIFQQAFGDPKKAYAELISPQANLHKKPAFEGAVPHPTTRAQLKADPEAFAINPRIVNQNIVVNTRKSLSLEEDVGRRHSIGARPRSKADESALDEGHTLSGSGFQVSDAGDELANPPPSQPGATADNGTKKRTGMQPVTPAKPATPARVIGKTPLPAHLRRTSSISSLDENTSSTAGSLDSTDSSSSASITAPPPSNNNNNNHPAFAGWGGYRETPKTPDERREILARMSFDANSDELDKIMANRGNYTHRNAAEAARLIIMEEEARLGADPKSGKYLHNLKEELSKTLVLLSESGDLRKMSAVEYEKWLGDMRTIYDKKVDDADEAKKQELRTKYDRHLEREKTKMVAHHALYGKEGQAPFKGVC